MARDGEAVIPVPYVSHLKFGHSVEFGQTLIILGEIPEDGNRFAINFLERDTTFKNNTTSVFYVNVRFDTDTIVFNTSREGYWENEEVVRNPFQRGENFDLRVRTEEQFLEIMADQKKIYQFKVRMPLICVDYLTIAGEVSLKCIRWDGKYLGSPCETLFDGGHFQTGSRLYVYGTPTGERFEIDLMSNDGRVLFHFNPRLSENTVVRNSMLNGAWGKEERQYENPFSRGEFFAIVIRNEIEQLQIYVGGKWFCSYEHRCSNPGNDYVRVHIEGGVQLEGVEFSH